MRCVISSIARSVENPAARLWPPPPKLRAISETSTPSGCDRSEPFRAVVAPGRQLAHERDELRAVDGPEVVDDPLRVRLLCAGRVEVLPPELGDDDPPVRELGRPLERAGKQLQLRERRRLVDLDEHFRHVGARLDELRREPKRLRRRVRVLEPARIGDECGVERLRDLRRQRDVQLPEDVGEHLTGGGRVLDDEVDVSEARVVVVVVDVDRERRLEQSRLDDPVLLRAVDGDEDALGDVRGRLAQRGPSLPGSRNPYSPGSGLAPPSTITRVLPERLEREVRREERAERVPVGVVVRGDDEALVRA